jgi:hypothetical protein
MASDYTQESSYIPTEGQLNSRQSQRFDYFSGTQLNTAGNIEPKPRWGRRQVKGRPDLIYWWVDFLDARGGLNVTEGDLDWSWDRAKASTLDTRFLRTLCLPQLISTDTSPDPTGNLKGFHAAEFLDTMVFGLGSGNDVSLFKETSTTDPTPVAITGAGTAGRPGAVITALAPIVLGSATAATQLLIGRDSGVPLLMTDIAGTLNGTAMHADLNPTWGAIQTPLNDRTILFLANGRLRTLASSDAVNTQPVVPESTVVYPNGGYAGGLLRLDNGPLRAYWGIPFENTTGGVLLFGTEKLHRCVSTNLEASDPQDITFGLEGGIAQFIISQANQALVAHNHERMVINKGGNEQVPVFVDRVPNSDREYRIRHMWDNGNEIIYIVEHRARSGGSGSTTFHWESFDLKTGAVHQISADTTYSTTGSFGVLNAGAGLLSRFTRYSQFYADGAWRQLLIPRYGENPYYLNRQTSGAGSGTGYEFAASGTWDWPDTEIPGLEGLPKVVAGIVFGGDVDGGGTAATAASVQITAGGITFDPFVTGTGQRSQVQRLKQNNHTFYRLACSVTMSRTTASTRFTPNALPFRIFGFAIRDVQDEAELLPVGVLTGASR